MKNVKKIIIKSWERMKDFPLSISIIFVISLLVTIFFNSTFITSKMFNNIILFGLFLFFFTFLLETIFQKEASKRKVGYFIGIVISIILVILNNIEFNQNYLRYIKKLSFCYIIILYLLAIFYNFKKQKITFYKYIRNVFINFFYSSIIYSVIALGALLLSVIFNYLLFDYLLFNLTVRIQILILGFYYVPQIILSFTNSNIEITKFLKILIHYILQTILLMAFAIIYLYIIKIILSLSMPSNQVGRIISGLFILGIPIWIINYTNNEVKIFSKINKILPYLFCPFILLQIYSIGLRISIYGLTPLRYLTIMLIIFEIIFILFYLKKPDKLENLIFVAIILVAISTIVPGINMDDLSLMNQKSILNQYHTQSNLTDDKKIQIYSAYEYLENNDLGQDFISSTLSAEEIEEIQAYYNIDNKYKYLNEVQTTEYSHLTRYFDTSFNEIKDFNYMYEVSANSYQNIDLKNIVFEGNDIETIVDLSQEINDIIEANDNNYLKDKYVINISDTKKLILTYINLKYNKDTKIVDYYNIDAYLLVK